MDRIGKFEVVRSLGQGSQSRVLLARDPVLDRHVAIKLLRLTGERSDRRDTLLREARLIGGLRHPGIVPVYEAGVHAGEPYLVLEYVEGQTLRDRLKRDGRLPAPQTAVLLSEILDALHQAHASGVIHRDLKPSNVFITRDGHARVIDFGIALRIGEGKDAQSGLAGTPAYMAPEYITHGDVGPQNDLFAAGLLLYEMLFGRAGYAGDNAYQVLHCIAHEPLVLPEAAEQAVDERLLDILAKACAKAPELRYSTAQAFRQDLQTWLGGAAEAQPVAGAGAIEFLLTRMRHKSDFPAMSAAIAQITQLSLSDRSDAVALSNVILKDLALTNKLLRVANSAYYGRPAGGRVNTVSRAIVILGFEALRNLAISLMLFERIADKRHAEQLKDEFLRANLRGLMARHLGAGLTPEMAEQAFLCGLFYTLGRLLTCYYFREEAEMIARIVAREACDEAVATRRVLGVSYETLGLGIARHWNFPETMMASMHRLPEGAVPTVDSTEARLRALSGCADLAISAIESGTTVEALPRLPVLQPVLRALGVSAPQLQASTRAAVEGLRELVQVLGLDGRRSRLSGLLGAPTGDTTPEHTDAVAGLSPVGGEAEADAEGSAESVLSAGIQDISRALVDESLRPGDLLCAVAELIFRALRVSRVLLCLREGNTPWMSARHGFGFEVERALRHMRFSLQGQDLFNLIIARDVDVLISDASAEKIARHLPPWYRQHFNAPCFLVLPLRLRGEPAAVIYAEADRAGGLSLSPEVLTLVRTLRNQGLMALKLDRR